MNEQASLFGGFFISGVFSGWRHIHPGGFVGLLLLICIGYHIVFFVFYIYLPSYE